MANFDLLYSTATMLKAIEQMPRLYTFLYDLFAQDGENVSEDTALYDYRKGAVQMAPFVVEHTGGVVMNRTGYQTNRVGFTTISPERIVTLEDIATRAFGEKVLGDRTPEQRAKELLNRDLKELTAAVQRRREWMVRQMLLTGKLEIFRYLADGLEKETTMVLDCNFTNTYTPRTKWNQAGANILYDMETIFNLVYDGLGQVDTIVMAPDVAHAMLQNSDYMKYLDMRNVDMGEINTRYAGQGVRFLGYNHDGVKLYSYAGKFLDDDGTMKACIPAGKLIAGSSAVKPLRVPHGPITKVEGLDENAAFRTFIKKEVPFRLGDSGSDTIKTRLVSRPTVIPDNIDAWCIATVL